MKWKLVLKWPDWIFHWLYFLSWLDDTVLWLFFVTRCKLNAPKDKQRGRKFLFDRIRDCLSVICLSPYLPKLGTCGCVFLGDWVRTSLWIAVFFGHVNGCSASKCSLTCALFDSGSFLQSVPTELALKIILPELCEPDIPSVVLQRPAGEVAVKTCKRKKENKTKPTIFFSPS